MTITLNRAEKLNALTSDMLRTLTGLLDEVATDGELRAIVLAGSTRAFCAGADIGEYSRLDDSTFEAFQLLGKGVNDRLARSSKPVIAAVTGPAFGGGFELALACDLMVMADHAVLALPEVGLGLVPGGGGTQRLPRLIGGARAKELLMLGSSIDAATAVAWGVASRTAHGDRVVEVARELAHEIAGRAPLAVAAAKRLVDRGLDLDLPSALDEEVGELVGLFRTEDGREGIRAFVEKRVPRFTGA